MKKLLGCTFLLMSSLGFVIFLAGVGRRFGTAAKSESVPATSVKSAGNSVRPVGDTVTATVSGRKDQLIAIAVGEPAFSELNTVLSAKDIRGLLDLMLSAKVFSIQNFSQDKVVENGLL